MGSSHRPARLARQWGVILGYFINSWQSCPREKQAMNSDEAEGLFLNSRPDSAHAVDASLHLLLFPLAVGAAQPRHAVRWEAGVSRGARASCRKGLPIS